MTYLFDQPAAARQSQRLPRAKRTRSGTWEIPGGHQGRLEGDQGRCAGCLRRAGARLSPPSPSTLCALSVPAIHLSLIHI